MKNLIELNSLELETVNGGATFAYRVGQFIRCCGWSALPGGHAMMEMKMML
jgi:hypothetical protein